MGRTATRVCPRCGARVFEDMRVCPSCQHDFGGREWALTITDDYIRCVADEHGASVPDEDIPAIADYVLAAIDERTDGIIMDAIDWVCG